MKIIVFGEQFHSPAFFRRWELMAQHHPDVELTLLTPDIIERNNKKNFKFGNRISTGKEIYEGNFRIQLIKRISCGIGWFSLDFKTIMLQIKPDIMYVSGGHHALHLYQILHIRNKYLPKTKIVSFSMRGPAYNLEMYKQKIKPLSKYIKRRFIFYNYARIGLRYFNKYCDAVFCHYPRAMECFREEGFKGPIYMQTQVGVNPELFHEDNTSRVEIRNK